MYNSKAFCFGFFFFLLQMETASIMNGTRYYVMAVTPTRLYSFTGIGSLEVRLTLTPNFCNEHV